MKRRGGFSNRGDNAKRFRSAEPTVTKVLDEKLAGILEFARPDLTPFFAIVKQRFADFIVKEVDRNGNVVTLTDITTPKNLTAEYNKSTDGANSSSAGGSVSVAASAVEELTPEQKLEKGYQQLETLLHDKLTVDSIRQFVGDEQSVIQAIQSQQETNPTADPAESGLLTTLCLQSETDKDRRTKIHQVINEYFPMLVSDTLASEDGQRFVRLRYKSQLLNEGQYIRKSQQQQNAQQNRQANERYRPGKSTREKAARDSNPNAAKPTFDTRSARSEKVPPFLSFVLYKENYDTTHAISVISKKIGVKSKMFSWAGTKDKRGITTQMMTAHRLTAERLAIANTGRFEGVRVGNFKYVEEPLRMGDLQGNRFTIALRKIDDAITDEDVSKSAEAIATDGFINYFGMQRFGINADYPTHQIGIHVLLEQWEAAVRAILQSRAADNPDLLEAIDLLYKDRNPEAAYQRIPRHMVIERLVFQGYAKNSNPQNDKITNHFGAFLALPRNLRSMYIHAYQSYVWNHMVSERIRRYGCTKPMVGDLVFLSPQDDDEVADEESAVDATVPEGDADQKQDDSAASSSSNSQLTKAQVKCIETEEEAGNYTIEDVAMPLPGFDISFPRLEGITEEDYKQFIGKQGVTMECFRHKNKHLMMGGAYRRILAKPKDVKWRIERYTDYRLPLTLSDLEVLQRKQLSPQPTVGPKMRALVIEFTLPKSAYATMFIRELLKQSPNMDWRAVNESIPGSATPTTASTSSSTATPDTATNAEEAGDATVEDVSSLIQEPTTDANAADSVTNLNGSPVA